MRTYSTSSCGQETSILLVLTIRLHPTACPSVLVAARILFTGLAVRNGSSRRLWSWLHYEDKDAVVYTT